MKKIAISGVVSSVLLSMFVTGAMAQSKSQMDAMKRCVDQEKTKSNDTRGGLSAVEFCAAVIASGS